MKTQEIINDIQDKGGLDMRYIERTARQEGVSIHRYIVDMIKAEYDCSDYIANKVANYYA